MIVRVIWLQGDDAPEMDLYINARRCGHLLCYQGPSTLLQNVSDALQPPPESQLPPGPHTLILC